MIYNNGHQEKQVCESTMMTGFTAIQMRELWGFDIDQQRHESGHMVKDGPQGGSGRRFGPQPYGDETIYVQNQMVFDVFQMLLRMILFAGSDPLI